jgi:hypothetical protein
MKKTIIHFSCDDYWNSNPASKYHIMKSFWKKDYTILWINPIGTRFPSIKRKKQFLGRIFRKVKSLLKLLNKIDDNYYVYTPFILPTFTENKVQQINDILLKFQISLLEIILKIKKPILFFSTPVYGNIINKIKYDASIYFYSDQYTLYRELSQENKHYLETLDRILYKKSDLIFCVSQMIYEGVAKKTDKPVYYYPHQVDFQFFQKSLKEDYEPLDIKNIPHPIIGYYGTLTDSNDWELIEYCAKNRPDYNFVFIGQRGVDLPSLEELNNVYFLGRKTYDEIPHYAKKFDVCLMFWIRREWIAHCSPLKLKEYLSLEKPVVSTYIEEVADKFTDIVFVSENQQEFLKNIDLALEDSSARTRKGVEKVRNDSWDTFTYTIESLLKN